MIFCYSATGNSHWAAKTLADALDERLVSVTDSLKSGEPLTYSISETETLGFVFPVHAWGPPQILLDFISRMELNGFDGQYVFALATCGDTAGNTMGAMARAFAGKGLPLDSKWELMMPNNYLPIYDVDSPEQESAKLERAQTDIEHIRELIAERTADTKLIGGRYGWLMSSLVNWLFRQFGMRSAPFFATDACISCGRCARICLTGAIRMGGEGKPEWVGKCDHCCACINRCPARAIQYGKATEKRGRYCHPIWRSGPIT